MKVVINRCYGGFGLSVLAKKKLFDMKDPHMKFVTWKEYHGTANGESKFSTLSKEKEAEMLEQPIRGNGIILDDHDDYKDRMAGRSCPLLVKIVEKLGKKASSRLADLHVVEIPDGIEWEIDEYDGIESIDEKHRSWS